MRKANKNEKRRVAKIPMKRGKVGEGGRDVGKEQGRKREEMIEASKRRKAKKAKVVEG